MFQYILTNIATCSTGHNLNNTNRENPMIQPVVRCTTSVANSNSLGNTGLLNPAMSSNIPPVSLQGHLYRCGSCQSMQGGNTVSTTGQNVQNYQTTESRVETPQIGHNYFDHSTTDPERATKMWDRVRQMKVLEKTVPKIKFSGKINEMNFERFMGRMEKAMDDLIVDVLIIGLVDWL
jgi:hypothetical protein